MQANLLQLSVQWAQARARYDNVDDRILLRLSRFEKLCEAPSTVQIYPLLICLHVQSTLSWVFWSESSFVFMRQVLAAILGEMHQTSGRVVSRGTIAYCAQQPWLISGTLRDNVRLQRR